MQHTNTLSKTQTESPFLPFALPEIGEEEIEQVVKCLRSGWLTSGGQMQKFEQDFTEFMGGNVHSIAVNSATFGLILAMDALGIGQGDEVITTPYTFSATGMSIVHLGATPVLVDIDPVTLNIDPANIEALITPKTKAIVPVHFAGLACDMDAICEIAKKHNLKVIEDAAHALPTKYKGKLIGSYPTDATVYSFYATKTITTGEGGMIVTPHKDVADRCKQMRLHGISHDVFDRYVAKGAKWHYEVTLPGYKCNMTDIAASMGIEQLKKAKRFQARRQEIAKQYQKAFATLPITLPADIDSDEDEHSWHLFVIRLNDNAPLSRDEFIERMDQNYKIGTSVHFIPLQFHRYWQETLKITVDDFPCAGDAYKQAVSLPLYTRMTDQDVTRVIGAVVELLS